MPRKKRDWRPNVFYHVVMSGNDSHNIFKTNEDMYHLIRSSDRLYKIYGYVGTIYQQRYFSKPAEDPQSLLIVSRYIHRNPIETNTPMVTNLADYPFSSFPVYARLQPSANFAFLDTNTLPELLPPPMEKTAEAYVEYCLAESEEGAGRI